MGALGSGDDADGAAPRTGWRRAIVGLAVGAAIGLVIGLLLPHEDGPTDR